MGGLLCVLWGPELSRRWEAHQTAVPLWVLGECWELASSLGPLLLMVGIGFLCSWIPEVSGGSIAHLYLTLGVLGKEGSAALSYVVIVFVSC